MLHLQLFLIFMLNSQQVHSFTWGQSTLSLSVVDTERGRISYTYRKATFPICHSISISASITYGKKSADGSISFLQSGDFARENTGNFANNRRSGASIERGWIYYGFLTPRVPWDHATFSFHCYARRRQRHLETIRITVHRPVHGVIGVLMYPHYGTVSMAVLMKHWSWSLAFLHCKGSGGRQGEYTRKAVCYAKTGGWSRDGLAIAECGTSILFAVTNFKCSIDLRTPINSGSSFPAPVYYWPEFDFKTRAESPLSPIIFQAKLGEDGWLTIPYLHMRDSIQDTITFEIKPDRDFSNTSVFGGSGQFVPATQTDSCDLSSAIQNDPSVQFIQSSEYGGFPASRAANNILDDFTHTKEIGRQWWSFYKLDFGSIAVLNIYSRPGYWSRLSNMSVGISNQKRRLVADIRDVYWDWLYYQNSPLGAIDGPTQITFVPMRKMTNLVIHSSNPTDALSLAEVKVEGSCVKEYRMKLQLPVGFEFILAATSHVQVSQSTLESYSSEESYKRFGTIGKDGKMSRSVCESLQIIPLQEYFGCRGLSHINQYKIDKCRKLNLTSLQSLLYCIAPYQNLERTNPIDRSYGLLRDNVDLYRREYSWTSSNQVGSLKSGSDNLINAGNRWLVASLPLIAGFNFY